ncbi:MAG: CDP-alcohol phosphatidyltransferase family protein [archaeon]|nr:MAG: CDP-alcohol phosphatidyltransferase family protein [archaeon]
MPKKSDKKLKEKIKKADVSRSGGIFYRTERKIIENWVKKFPLFLTPDRLTAISIISAALIGLCFYLTNFSKIWLLFVCLFLFTNWIGDSFDGEVARYRKIQRPRYGYYIDHVLDAFVFVFMIVGLGLSPYLSMTLALALVICFLLLNVMTSIAAYTQASYRIGYGGLGGTEGRIVFFVFSLILFFFIPASGTIFFLGATAFTFLDLIALICLGLFTYMIIIGFVVNIRHFNKVDKKTYKEMTIAEAFDKLEFIQNLRKSDVGKFLSGEYIEQEIKKFTDSFNGTPPKKKKS